MRSSRAQRIVRDEQPLLLHRIERQGFREAVADPRRVVECVGRRKPFVAGALDEPAQDLGAEKVFVAHRHRRLGIQHHDVAVQQAVGVGAGREDPEARAALGDHVEQSGFGFGAFDDRGEAADIDRHRRRADLAAVLDEADAERWCRRARRPGSAGDSGPRRSAAAAGHRETARCRAGRAGSRGGARCAWWLPVGSGIRRSRGRPYALPLSSGGVSSPQRGMSACGTRSWSRMRATTKSMTASTLAGR
jgi:hypothetical protein